MASNTQETLYDLFTAIAGGQGLDLGGLFRSVLGGSAATSKAVPESGGGALSVASAVLKSGMGMMPLVSGILHLFGGDDPPEPPPLVKYALPPRLTMEMAAVGNGIANVDSDQFGLPRSYGQRAAASEAPPVAAGGDRSAPAPQITVNVQAMDARSFLDRSTDIAAAVREAMLHMNSINDVISEL